MKHTSRQLTTVVVLGLIILIIASVWAFLYLKIRGLRENYQVALQELLQEEERVRTVEALRALVDTTKGDREDVSKIFVKEDDIVVFFDDLQSLSDHAGLLLKIDNADIKDGALELTLSGTGTFSQSLYFLQLLESWPYNISIKSAETINVGQDVSRGISEDKWRTRVSLRLTSFLSKEAQVQTSEATTTQIQ